MNIKITTKQDLFINSEAFETLFGGAAGGGKSYGGAISIFGKVNHMGN